MAASLEDETQQPYHEHSMPQPTEGSSFLDNVHSSSLDIQSSSSLRRGYPPSSPSAETADTAHTGFLDAQLNGAAPSSLAEEAETSETIKHRLNRRAQGKMLEMSELSQPVVTSTQRGVGRPTWKTSPDPPPASETRPPVPVERFADADEEVDELESLPSRSTSTRQPPPPDEETPPHVPTPTDSAPAPPALPNRSRSKRKTPPSGATSPATAAGGTRDSGSTAGPSRPLSAHKPPAITRRVGLASGSRSTSAVSTHDPVSPSRYRRASKRQKSAPAPAHEETQETFGGGSVHIPPLRLLDQCFEPAPGVARRRAGGAAGRVVARLDEEEDELASTDQGEGEDDDAGGPMKDVEKGEQSELEESAGSTTTKESASTDRSNGDGRIDGAGPNDAAHASSPAPAGSIDSPSSPVRHGPLGRTASTQDSDGHEQSMLFTPGTVPRISVGGPDHFAYGPATSGSEAVDNDLEALSTGDVPIEMQVDDVLVHPSSGPDPAPSSLIRNAPSSPVKSGQTSLPPSSPPAEPDSAPLSASLAESRPPRRRLGAIAPSQSMFPRVLSESQQEAHDGPSKRDLFSSQGEFESQLSSRSMHDSFEPTQRVAMLPRRGTRRESDSAGTEDRALFARSSPARDDLGQDAGNGASDEAAATGMTQTQLNTQEQEQQRTQTGTQELLQSQTQVASDETQRRAQEAAERRRKEQEESLERREEERKLHEAAEKVEEERVRREAEVDKQRDGAAVEQPKPTTPVKAIREVPLHRRLTRGANSRGSAVSASASLTPAALVTKDKAAMAATPHDNATGDASAPISAGDLEQPTVSPGDVDMEGGGVGEALTTTAGPSRVYDRSPTPAEPSSSMQAEDLLVLRPPTQQVRTPSPTRSRKSSLDPGSQPVRRGTRRGRGQMTRITESSPRRDSSPRTASSPLRSDPPTPPDLNGEAGADADADADVDVDADAEDGKERQDSSEARDDGGPAGNDAQTFEPTFVDGQTVPTLVEQPKMRPPARTYKRSASPVKPASKGKVTRDAAGSEEEENAPRPAVADNRRLTRRRRESTDPLARPAESLAATSSSKVVPAVGKAGAKGKGGSNRGEGGKDAEPLETENGQEGQDEAAVRASARRGKSGRARRRVAESDGAATEASGEDAAEGKETGPDVDPESAPRDPGRDMDDESDVDMDRDAADDTHETRAEQEDTESPPTPVDVTDETFRPPAKKTRRSTTRARAATPPAVPAVPALSSRRKAAVDTDKRIATLAGSSRGSKSKAAVPVADAADDDAQTNDGSASPSPKKKGAANVKAPSANRKAVVEPEPEMEAASEASLEPEREDGDAEEESPESPPTQVDPTDYSFRPSVAKRTSAARRSRATSAASASTTSARPNGAAVVKKSAAGKGQGAKPKVGAAKGKGPRGRATDTAPADNDIPLPTPSASALTEVSDAGDSRAPIVMAPFGPNYFAGRVVGQDGTSFHVIFFDDDDDLYPLDKLRSLEFVAGETVRQCSDTRAEYEVASDWPAEDGDLTGESEVPVKRKGGDEVIGLPLADLRVPLQTVRKNWTTRTVSPGFLVDVPLGNLDRLKKGSKALGAKQSKSKAGTGSGSGVGLGVNGGTGTGSGEGDALAGKVFLLTPSGKETEDVAQLIRRHGGGICDWEALFEDASHPHGGGVGTGKVQVRFGQGMKGSRAPFLVTTQEIGAEFEANAKGVKASSMKAKIMCALAFGVPCLSVGYVLAAVENPECDLRPFLLSPGRSALHGFHTSQAVSPMWGRDGWAVALARHELRPLEGKRVLFLGTKSKDLQAIVEACLFGLSAAALTSEDAVGADVDLAEYEVILVPNKDKKGPQTIQTLGKRVAGHRGLCDVQWLKQVCIAGCWLPPKLYSWT